MTLVEVAVKQHTAYSHESHVVDDYPCAACVASEVVKAFEADPDFTLRDRVEAELRRIEALGNGFNGDSPGPLWGAAVLEDRRQIVKMLRSFLSPPNREGPA